MSKPNEVWIDEMYHLDKLAVEIVQEKDGVIYHEYLMKEGDETYDQK